MSAQHVSLMSDRQKEAVRLVDRVLDILAQDEDEIPRKPPTGSPTSGGEVVEMPQRQRA